jgi:hypothetical protein
MFRIQQLTYFGPPSVAAAPQIPVGSSTWAPGSDDPFFTEVNPAAMGYRSATRGFAGSGSGQRHQRAFSLSSR